MLPYFKRLGELRAGGDDAYRGRDGPMTVEDYRTVLPVTHCFVAAAQEAGIPLTPDYNGARQEGVGYSQNSRRGRFRASTARSFLREARAAAEPARRNQRAGQPAPVRRQTLHRRDAPPRRPRFAVTAAREVIAGGRRHRQPASACKSPGSARRITCARLGVDVVHAAPDVGAQPVGPLRRARGSSASRPRLGQPARARCCRWSREALRYVVTGRGALTFGVTTAMVFARSREGLESPDLQLSFTPMSREPRSATASTSSNTNRAPASRSASRSRKAAAAFWRAPPDPTEYPVIRPNYLSAPRDVDVMVAGLRLARKIFAAPSWMAHSDGEVRPGAGVNSDAELADYARANGASVFHPVGTCRMGADAASVVDSAPARARHCRSARHRCLDHADGDDRQHQRAHDHDRRERRGHDPGGCTRIVAAVQGLCPYYRC